ncbi:MAG: DoxX family membrane protein [Gammaproteobacteria bacterium]|nr:DoxX family membrane protein [Gammaproteobacteria bacterium]
MNKLVALWQFTVKNLNCIHHYVSPLGLRLLLAYEFWDSGVMKYVGENWFAEIMHQFPFPFDVIPAGISWQLATWSELVGAIALVLGLGTRFFSLSLIIVTIVAWYAVHAGNGYNVSNNGWKLPLIYLVMFVPLLLGGAGRLSLDYWLKTRLVPRFWGRAEPQFQ